MDAELCSEPHKCISMRDCLQCPKATSALSPSQPSHGKAKFIHLWGFSNINNCSDRWEQWTHQYLSQITFQKLFEQQPDLYAFLVTINWVYIQSTDLEVKLSQQKHSKQLRPSDVDDFISLIGFHWFSQLLFWTVSCLYQQAAHSPLSSQMLCFTFLLLLPFSATFCL